MTETDTQDVHAPEQDGGTAAEVLGDGSADGSSRWATWWKAWDRWLLLAIGLASFAITALLLTPGHFWGDDWTLYVRQAEGILHLRTGDVVRDARFTVDESIGPAFSPRVYPWGTALLLLAPIAVFGRHIAALKLTMAFSMGVVTMTFFAVSRRRMGYAAAFGAACCIALSLPMLRWADVIGSDIPYVAAVGVCLAVFARWHTMGGFDRRRVIVLGALGAITFAFRQEGLTMFVALMAGVAWSGVWASRTMASVKATAVNLTAGVATFVGVTLVGWILLPYELLPSYEGSGIGRIRPSIFPYLRAMGDQYGVFSGARNRIEALDQPWLGWTLIVLGSAFVVVGVGTLLRRHDALDVVLVLALGFHAYAAFTALHSNSRYLYTTVALVTVVGAQGIATIAQMVGRATRAPAWILVAMLALPAVWVQVPRYFDATERAADARDRNAPWNGPFEPSAAEMLVAVEQFTAPGDVVGFRKARAITLFTDRSAVQTPWPSAVPPIADWYVSEKDKSGKFVPPTESVCDCTATEAWSNRTYTLYQLDHD